jgi:hypothetical protein
MNINKKSFTLINRIRKTFPIIIANFEFATTLLFRIIQQIDISFVATFAAKVFTTINVKRIRATYIMKLLANISQVINSRYVKITYSMKQIMKFVVPIDVEMQLGFVSKAIQKLITVMNAGKIHFTATAIYAVFSILGTFDPQTLGTLDADTLGTMDYTLV